MPFAENTWANTSPNDVTRWYTVGKATRDRAATAAALWQVVGWRDANVPPSGAQAVQRADRLNDYFAAATKAYAFKDDEEAGFAAFAVAVTVKGTQRSGMIAFTQTVAAELERGSPGWTPDEEARVRLIVARLRILAERIASKDWSLADSMVAQRQLRKVSRSYFDALGGKVDPAVFHRRYPDIFSEHANPVTEPAKAPFCTACGARIDVAWSFCGECGAQKPSRSRL